MISLPFNELWFNIMFWILISMYGISEVWKFIVSIPDSPPYDKEFKYDKLDYIFWLLTSLIFYFIWIFEFQYIRLIFLTILEIIITLIIYIYIFIKKQQYLQKKKKKLKKIKDNIMWYFK